jgi:DNA repair protein RAD16
MGKVKGKGKRNRDDEEEAEREEVPSDYYPSDDSVADEDFTLSDSEGESENEEDDGDVEVLGSSDTNNNNASSSSAKGKAKSEKRRKIKDSDDESDCEVPSISPLKSESKKKQATKKKKGKATPNKKKPRRHDDFIWDEHDADNLEETIYVAKEAPQPEALRVTLLRFQRESLEWMTKQEKDDKAKGGILADDMGMGKTLQAISLVLTNKPDAESEHRTTLVVCPVVALVQWHTEILKYTKPNTFKILIYHGSKRLTESTQEAQETLSEYDIVLTT